MMPDEPMVICHRCGTPRPINVWCVATPACIEYMNEWEDYQTFMRRARTPATAPALDVFAEYDPAVSPPTNEPTEADR